jgi:hypothetical protein
MLYVRYHEFEEFRWMISLSREKIRIPKFRKVIFHFIIVPASAICRNHI